MNQFKFYSFFKNIDKILMSLVVFLLLIGLITLASASQQNINLIGNQILNILIGMALLIILSQKIFSLKLNLILFLVRNRVLKL